MSGAITVRRSGQSCHVELHRGKIFLNPCICYDRMIQNGRSGIVIRRDGNEERGYD